MKSYKNSSKNQYRKSANERSVKAVMEGGLEGIYAKVLNHVGNGRVKVYYENDSKPVETIALIRGLLRRRGQVPIQTDDIVIITGRDFEREDVMHFDIIGVLTSKQKTELVKNGSIPQYYLHGNNTDNFKAKEVNTDEFEFDDEKVEVDIDKI